MKTTVELLLGTIMVLGSVNIPMPMEASKLKLTEVYSRRLPEKWNAAFLPDGEQLLLWRESGMRFTLLDWRRGVSRELKLTVADNVAASSLTKNRRVTWVEFVPNTSFLFLMIEENLFRIDRHDWRVVEAYGQAYVEVARDGSFVVVIRRSPSGVEATVIETSSWSKVRSTSLPEGRAILTPDNKYLAVDQIIWREDKKQCLMAFYEVESGKLARVTDFLRNNQDCPVFLQSFHPTRPSILIAERFAKSVTLWDTESGLPVAKIEEPYRLQMSTISPNGRWLYGSVRERDPQILRDFKIWDMEAGTVVYESPTYRNRARTRSDNDPVTGFFSPDSKLLAVRTSKRLTLYRLEEK